MVFSVCFGSSSFSQEMKVILNGGNQRAFATWLALWDASAYPAPDPQDDEELLEFMRMKVSSPFVCVFVCVLFVLCVVVVVVVGVLCGVRMCVCLL